MTVGVLLHVAFFWTLTIPLSDPRPPDPPEAGIVLTEAGPSAFGQLVADQATLLDSAPLFLPTRWNFASRIDQPAEDPAQLLWTGDALVADLGNEPPLEGPADLLAARLWPVPTEGLGTRDRTRQPLPARAVHLRIRSLADGSIRERSLSADAVPENLTALQATLWSPATFLVTRAADGSRIPPLLVTSTQSDPVDAALRTWLAGGRALSELPAGSYEVVIGP
jgi:hypothetical protein